MMNTNYVALETVLKEEGFVKYLLSLETPEAAQKAFADKGIEFTVEEINEIAKELNNSLTAISEDEFTEDNEVEDDYSDEVVEGDLDINVPIGDDTIAEIEN